VKESRTRSTQKTHVARLLPNIDRPTVVGAIATETSQDHVNARARENGRGRRPNSHVTSHKDSSVSKHPLSVGTVTDGIPRLFGYFAEAATQGCAVVGESSVTRAGILSRA
jgi:hypothetical protein